jgi:hypothetical protein
VEQSSRLRKDCSLYEEEGEESLTLQGSSIFSCPLSKSPNEALKRLTAKL